MPPEPRESEPPAGPRERLALAAVFVVALALRLWHLGARSVWTDEGSTWSAATATLHELIRLCAEKDASPPLFYLLTSVAMKLGSDEAHLRFVSVLASLGLVALTYRFVRLYAGRLEATLAAALMAVSPYQIMYAQEARSYALVGCFAVASLYFYTRAVFLGHSRSWWAFVLVTTLGLYTQILCVLVLGVQAALALLTRQGRRRVLPWLGATALCFALYVPWAIVSYAQMSRLGESHWYLMQPGIHELVQVPRAIFLSPVPLVTAEPGSRLPGLDAWLPRHLAHLLLALVPLAPIIAATPSAMERSRRGLFLRVTLAALILPPLAVLAVMHWKPLWLARYFVFLSPFYCGLLARGITALRPRALAMLWTALTLAGALDAVLQYDAGYTKEPWRDVVHEIASRATPGKTAVLVTFDIDPFRFYDVKLEHPIPAFELSHPDVPFASGYSDRQLAEMMDAAARRTAAYDEVWLVVRSPNSDVRREVGRRGEAIAAFGRRFAGRWRWDATNGPLRVVRYVRGT